MSGRGIPVEIDGGRGVDTSSNGKCTGHKIWYVRFSSGFLEILLTCKGLPSKRRQTRNVHVSVISYNVSLERVG